MSDIFTPLAAAMGISLLKCNSSSMFHEYSNEEFKDDLTCIVAIGLTMKALLAIAGSTAVTVALGLLGIVLVAYATYILVKVAGELWGRIYPGKK